MIPTPTISSKIDKKELLFCRLILLWNLYAGDLAVKGLEMPHRTDHLHLPVMEVARQDFTKLLPEFTAQEALDHIRREGVGEKIVYFYVVDEDDQLKGVLPTRRLLAAPLHQRISELMISKLIVIPQTATVMDACDLFILHKFLAFPVVDEKRRIVGVVDVGVFTDEVFDVAQREQWDEVFEAIGFRVSHSRPFLRLRPLLMRGTTE